MLAVAAAAALGLPASVPAAGRDGATAARAAAGGRLADRVAAAVRPLGAKASVMVADARSGRRVAALRAQPRRPLGSTTKLLTAAAVLRRLGPRHVLGTQVLGSAAIGAGGCSPATWCCGAVVTRSSATRSWACWPRSSAGGRLRRRGDECPCTDV